MRQSNSRHRGSYISTRVLLNSLNEFGEIRCEALLSIVCVCLFFLFIIIILFFLMGLINSRIQEHECKILFSYDAKMFALKRQDFATRNHDVLIDFKT